MLKSALAADLFVDASGREVQVDQAWLSIAEVELLSCEEASVMMTGLRLFTRSRARAHGLTLNALGVVAMMPGDVAQTTLFPAPGEYCGVRLHLRPDTLEEAANASDPASVYMSVKVDRAPRQVALSAERDVDVMFAERLTVLAPGVSEVSVSIDPLEWFERRWDPALSAHVVAGAAD